MNFRISKKEQAVILLAKKLAFMYKPLRLLIFHLYDLQDFLLVYRTCKIHEFRQKQ